MTNFTPINFTLAKDSKTIVVADRRMPYALYVQNKGIAETLGGTVDIVIVGTAKCMQATFTNAANAKKFLKKAVHEMTSEEYEASRNSKPEEASKQAKESKPKTDSKGNGKPAKGSKKSNARKGKGNDAPTKAATEVKEVKVTKVELTPSAQKALDKMKMSVLNRAASAYSIANGGAATTFTALGKSAEELKAFMPKAKEGLLKSPKWIKASATYGLTEDMLG